MREKERRECGGDAGAGEEEEDHRCSDGGHPQGWCGRMLRWGEMNNNNVLPSFPSGVIDFGRLLLQIDPNTHLCD